MNFLAFVRRNAVGLLLLASFSGCSALIGLPIYEHAVTNARRASCQSNLHAIALAAIQYSRDNDGRFPPLSDGGSRGWSTLLLRYKPALNFSCPAGYVSNFSPSNDYFFNAQLARRKANSVQNFDMTVAFGDGPDNGPSNSHLSEIPNDFNNESAFTRRHGIGANYAFTDGHVKWQKREWMGKWIEDATGTSESRFKFSPDESAVRLIPHPSKARSK